MNPDERKAGKAQVAEQLRIVALKMRKWHERGQVVRSTRTIRARRANEEKELEASNQDQQGEEDQVMEALIDVLVVLMLIASAHFRSHYRPSWRGRAR